MAVGSNGLAPWAATITGARGMTAIPGLATNAHCGFGTSTHVAAAARGADAAGCRRQIRSHSLVGSPAADAVPAVSRAREWLLASDPSRQTMRRPDSGTSTSSAQASRVFIWTAQNDW